MDVVDHGSGLCGEGGGRAINGFLPARCRVQTIVPQVKCVGGNHHHAGWRPSCLKYSVPQVQCVARCRVETIVPQCRGKPRRSCLTYEGAAGFFLNNDQVAA